jgi:hypothetical protein
MRLVEYECVVLPTTNRHVNSREQYGYYAKKESDIFYTER